MRSEWYLQAHWSTMSDPVPIKDVLNGSMDTVALVGDSQMLR